MGARLHVSCAGCQGLRVPLAPYADTLAGFPLPAHRPQGWGDAIAAFDARLDAAGQSTPRQAMDVADHSARRMFDTALPVCV